MVLLGGLEFVVGGYFVHRHYKHKNEQKRLEVETNQRRINTFPGAKPQAPYQQHAHQHHPVATPEQAPRQKYTYNSPPIPPRPQAQPQQQPYYDPQSHSPPPISHTQSFNIPRRPVPPKRPQPQQSHQNLPQLIQPLQRADSMATISRMPIANGYRPGGMNGNSPQMASQLQVGTLSPIPQSPYSTSGFSVSSPALNANTSPTTPHTPIYGTGPYGRHQTVDDNWETYASPNGRSEYAPSVSTALGEHYDPDEPPPPYRP